MSRLHRFPVVTSITTALFLTVAALLLVATTQTSYAGAALDAELAEAFAGHRATVPVADAGTHRTVVIGEHVMLDGTASTDLDGERLTYAWTLHAPAGSGARLSNPSSPRPNFTIDLLGDYRAVLVVSDGVRKSAPASVIVSTSNVPPVAVTGHNARIWTGETTALDASESFDFDGDGLNVQWHLVEAPRDSQADLADSRASSPTFTPDVPGDYVFDLSVSDGRSDGASARLRLSTVNAWPHSDAGADRRIAAGTATRLDAAFSYDPDGGQLDYRWSVLHAPAGSAARLDGAQSASPLLFADVAGVYVVQLAVSDGRRVGQPDTIVIEALPLAASMPFQTQGVVNLLRNSNLPVRGGGSDIDGDGVPDAIDNCVETPNPDQIDTNGDGFGNRCDPDLNNDGLITNTVDLGLLKQAFFSTPGDPNWNPDADFNGDGIVNVIELGILKFFFFNAPGPIANIFINPAGGTWHDPANWSLGFVPNAAHAVRIDLDPGIVVEYSMGSTQISSIRTTSPLDITGGSLNITRIAEFNDTVTISSATLQGAPMETPTVNPNATIEIPFSTNVVLDGITLANDMNVSAGSTITVLNGLTLESATINLLSNNSTTSLTFNGSNGEISEFNGTGEVVFGGTATVDNRNRILVSGSGHGLTVASGITIRTDTAGGQVLHGNNNGPITLQGAVEASNAIRSLTLEGAPLTIDGSLQVSNDGYLIVAAFGSGSVLSAAATASINTGELELRGDFTIEGTVTVTDGLLDIGNNTTDPWDNNGSISLTDSTIELGGSFAAANIGTVTGSDTAIINGLLDNTGQTLNLGTLLPGFAVQLGTGGTILGGTIIGTALTLPMSNTFTLDGVTLNTDLDIEAGGSMTVLNDLILNGATIRLLSNNSNTTLNFSGAGGDTSTLGGTGEVVFDGTATVDNRNRLQVTGSTHGLTVASGVTIRSGTAGGRVFHSSNNGPITLQGPVQADNSIRSVTIEGAPLTVEGSLLVSNDGYLIAVAFGSGSTIAASATVSVNTGELELRGDFTNNANMTITNGTLDIGNSGTDDWNNNGSITLTNGIIELGGSFTAADIGTVTGSGTALINGVLDNIAQTLDLGSFLPGLTIQFTTGGTILGGTITGAPLTIPSSNSFTFDGVTLNTDLDIEAGSTLTLLNDLLLDGAVITLLSNNSNTTLVFSGTSGDTSTLGGTGEVVIGGTATVDNRNRIQVTGSMHNFTIGSGVTIRTDTAGGRIFHSSNNGTVTLQGTVQANNSSRSLTIEGAPLTVEGSLLVSNDGYLIAAAFGSASTIDASATVSINTGELELRGEFTNEDAITVTDGVLDIGNNANDPWDNNGSITLNNSLLELGGSYTAADVGTVSGSGNAVINGLLDNSGMTVDLATLLPGLTAELGTGGTILGGTVSGSTLILPTSNTFTLDGVILAADMDVAAGASVTALNDLILSGATVTLLSNNSVTSLVMSGAGGTTSTLGGTGEVVFGGTATVNDRNRLQVSGSTHNLTISSGVTIRTATAGGRVFHLSNNGTVTLQGTVQADNSSRSLTIEGAPLTVEGSLLVSNDGYLIAVARGSASTIDAAATVSINTGELEIRGEITNADAITVTDGVLDIGNNATDPWDNNGSITLNNSTLELGGSFVAADVGTVSGSGTGVINGLLDNTSATLDLAALLPGLTTQLGTGGTILNGTISGATLTLPVSNTFTLDGVTLNADLDIEAGATTTVLNDLVLNGTVTLLSNNSTTSLSFGGASGTPASLTGTGDVVFGGTATVDNRNRLQFTGSNRDVTIGAGITIRSDTAGGSVFKSSNTGTTTIQGDVLSQSGDTVFLEGFPLVIEGSLSVGAGSVIDLTDYSFAASADVSIDIGGTSTSDFGRLQALNDTADLAGTLNLALVNGFSPLLGDTFQIMSFDSRTGTFDTVNGTAIGGGLDFVVNYNATDVELEVN